MSRVLPSHGFDVVPLPSFLPPSPPSSWEQEKTRRAQKWQEEQRKESYSKDECEKDSDTGDDLSDIPEPQEVTLAREHVATLLGEQDKLHKQKVQRGWRASQLKWEGMRAQNSSHTEALISVGCTSFNPQGCNSKSYIAFANPVTSCDSFPVPG